MNKEEFLKAIENVPKIDSINPISAYNSINVEDLANAVDRFKKVPTYDELLKENQKLETEKEQLNSLVNSCQEEIRRLKKQLEEYKDKVNWYENFEINKTIDKLRIRHNNQQREFMEYMTKTIEELECDDVDDEEMKGYLIQRIDIFKEILKKYNEKVTDINVGSKGDI